MFASRLPSGGSGSRSSFHSASLYSAVHSTGLSGHFCPPTIPQWDIHLLDRNLLLRQSVLLWWPLDLSGFSLRYYVSSPRKKIFSSFPAKSLRLSPRKKILALFQENLSPHLRKRCRIRDFRQTDLAVLHPKTIPFNWGRKSRCLLEKSLALISYMCTHICTCVYRSEVDIGCLSSSVIPKHYSLIQGLSLNLELEHIQAKLAGQQCPVSFMFLPPCPWLFMWVLAIQS